MDEGGAWQAARARLIKDLGNFYEATGHNEIMGRLVGLLAFATEPLALTEMARELHISKAAASIHLRTLRQFEMAEKVSLPGDRSDYYVMHADFAKGLIRSTIRETHGFIQILDRTLEKITSVSDGPGRVEQDQVGGRLGKFRETFAELVRVLEELMRAERQ